MLRTKKKKVLTQEEVQKFVDEFIKVKKYTPEKIGKDTNKFTTEFLAWLESQNIETSNIKMRWTGAGVKDKPANPDGLTSSDPIHKISEDLNERFFDFDVYTDTTKLMAGLVCYEIEKIEPTAKKPYVTYKPAPRIIVAVHDNGVNGGTLFMTYSHKISHPFDFNASTPQVISEYEVLYSPLSKGHAEYICKLLNMQSRQKYKQAMLKIKNAKGR